MGSFVNKELSVSRPSNLPKIVSRLLFVAVLGALVNLAGCAPKVAEKQPQRFFWPPPPAEPHIEFVDYFLVEKDLDRGETDNWLLDAILGKDAPEELFNTPTDVASDGRRVMVTDSGRHEVLVLDRAAKKLRFLSTAAGEAFVFSAPYGVAIDTQGNAYVTDTLARKVLVFGPDETLVTTIGEDKLLRPTGLAVDTARNRLYVADTAEHRVVVFDLNGQHLFDWGGRGPGEGKFNFPTDVDVDVDGTLYVLDTLNARVQVLDSTGNFLRAFGERGSAIGSFQIPKGIAVSPSGLVVVTDSLAKRFVIFNAQGDYLLTIGGRQRFTGTVSPGGFYLPTGVDIDQDNAIWIVDSMNRIVNQYQHLTENYLKLHPIVPEDVYTPAIDSK
ncbi:MAG: 6-bladed beta-propeller [Desulfuromonadales bacterium]|nr:6-bladed beta-propeller [Desulfuromonadales bacterium]